ncbi:Alpha galactosidase A [Plantibacter flavus]|uniref:Alpha-galactosidase n=1 Tax=Plantibacter flavus TaxID=150123 RepID=A0A3N2C2J7_9MICO|nr:glycoside hydrolase family 27 protein [Plantibacter flavus]ROR81736.1 alpha galactosidase A [Plantibacter flavus]SMG16160.1 Alpha galactosidase A [Plantibacter flavus]
MSEADVAITEVRAARRARADRPPMGWNSWDCFGGSVTEAEVLANAAFLAEHLLPVGWDTVVVDIQWYEPAPGVGDYERVSQPTLDAWGRPQPAPNRFPSAVSGGFRALADRVHVLGLRFGVHLMRGVPRLAVDLELPILGSTAHCGEIADPTNVCPWNPDNVGVDMTAPGAQAYYDSVMAQLADWGVDLIKLDDVLYPPIQTAEIEAISRAIDATGRPMVLSLSPGKRLSTEHLDTLRSTAQLWRISDDLWDDWSAVLEQFQRLARWAPLQRPGAWADADMLPLGRIGIRAHVGSDRLSRLTLAEQRTLMTLWCIARSPLFFGGHLPDTPTHTLTLLTNPDVLALLGSDGSREVIRDGSLVVWAAELGETRWRAVFWLGDADTELRVHLADLGCADRSSVTELWSGRPLPVVDGAVDTALPAHGAVLLRLDH